MSGKSPKADRTTLDKVSKLLPLLNSAIPAEAQAAAAALAKYDLRDVAVSLREDAARQALHSRLDDWRAEEQRELQLQLEQLRKQAQELLNRNSPLLTDKHRKSLNKIVQHKLNENENQARHRRDLNYWSERLRVIRWEITPHVKELENALSVAAKHADRARSYARDVFNPKSRAQIANWLHITQEALTKAAEAIKRLEATL